MNVKLLVLILALASLAACAQSPVSPPGQSAAAVVTPSAAPAAARPAPLLPAQPLTDRLLYQFMLGEIAGQRGDLALANEAYADLARKTRDPRVVRRAAEIATYARDAETAVEMAGLWVEIEPDSVRARQYLASTLIGADRLAEAKPHLEALLRLGDRPLGEAFLQLHGMLARYKDKMAVFGLVRDLAAGHPALPEARLALAQSALDAGQHAQAVAALDEALRLRPEWEAAALLKGQALARQGDDAVLGFWRDYLARYPAAERLRMAYAKALTKVGRYADARGQFDALVERSPDSPELRFAIGLLAMQMDDLDAAVRYLEAALALGFADPDLVRGYLGQAEEGRRRHEPALAWYLKVEPGEHYLQARLRAALMLGHLARVEEGRALLRKLEVPDTDRHQVVQAEAQLLREADRYQEAHAVLSKALAQAPDSGELLYDRAMIAERLGRLDLVEADLRRLIELEPDHAHAYNALGYTLIDHTDRLQEGIALLDKALALRPDDPFILDSMGWAQYKAGRLRESLGHLRRAYALRADPEIAAHLGEVLWTMGQRDEARRIWQGALQEHPDSDLLKKTLSRFTR